MKIKTSILIKRVCVCVSVHYMLMSNVTLADTGIIIKKYNPLIGKLENSYVKVSGDRVNLSRFDNQRKKYRLIDTAKSKYHMIDPVEGSVYTRNLVEKSSYNDAADLKLIGEGPKLLDEKYPTSHYVFSAKGLTCSHMYIYKGKTKEDLRTYLKTFMMVPIKVKGIKVSRKDRQCQRAARSAARKIQQLGLPMLIINKDKDINNTVFKIDSITLNHDFSEKLFMLPETYKTD